jgi:hypothetical protein
VVGLASHFSGINTAGHLPLESGTLAEVFELQGQPINQEFRSKIETLKRLGFFDADF